MPAFEQILVPPELLARLALARPEAGILAEQLSGIASNLVPADASGVVYFKRISKKLAEMLRRHVALELDVVGEFLEPKFGHTEADCLLLSLSAAEESARDALVFVAPPAYRSTEARVLRHNPKPPGFVRLRDIEDT